jgi:hypothetical protein
MSFFWDLIQQSQLSKSVQRTGSLEERVIVLEAKLAHTQWLLHETRMRFERRLGDNLNGDGRMGP